MEEKTFEVTFHLYKGNNHVKQFVMGLTMSELEENRLLDPAARLKFAEEVLRGAGHDSKGADRCWFSLRGSK